VGNRASRFGLGRWSVGGLHFFFDEHHEAKTSHTAVVKETLNQISVQQTGNERGTPSGVKMKSSTFFSHLVTNY
jgi:hypothetical protein